MLIGHVDSKNGPGIFYKLPQLKKGDVVMVTRSDRSVARFRVQLVKRYPKRSFPTALVYQGDGKASLRLVTCGGEFDRSTGHYLDNTIVFAAPLPSAGPKAAPAQPAKTSRAAPHQPAPAKLAPLRAVPDTVAPHRAATRPSAPAAGQRAAPAPRSTARPSGRRASTPATRSP